MSDTAPQTETPDQALARALNAAKLRRINESIGICRDLLAATPDLPGALGLLGGILGQEGHADEAIGYLRAAVARQPNVGNWHLNLCALYRGKNMLDEALAAGLEAVRTSPDTAAHRVELALTHLTRGERELASLRYREAMGREPENPAAHMGLGELLLSLGEYGPGWMEYAWRNKLDQARGTLPKMTAAQWNGMALPGGSLLLVADQGFGDMIQFARYIPWVKQRVPRLSVGWGPEVTALLGHHPDIDVCFPKWADAPPHDAYVLLSSLPQIFGTELASIPAPIPYLSVSEARIAHWGQRLTQLRPQRRLRVGLAWSGRPTHPNNLRRSVRLATLAPILATPDVDFFGLQKPFPDEDRAVAAAHPHFTDLSPELADFAETGAVMRNLDLVVAVDTAVVHLAGALGVPAWVLVPEPADWRWLLGRSDSPWYPTLRLFRQERATEWGPVVGRVAEALGRKEILLPEEKHYSVSGDSREGKASSPFLKKGTQNFCSAVAGSRTEPRQRSQKLFASFSRKRRPCLLSRHGRLPRPRSKGLLLLFFRKEGFLAPLPHPRYPPCPKPWTDRPPSPSSRSASRPSPPRTASACSPTTSPPATSPPPYASWWPASRRPTATRSCSASPARARPSPWPR